MEFNYKEYVNKSVQLDIDHLPKILVVEGFDCTGKSYFIDKLCKDNGLTKWEPKYDSDINNRVIPYSDRYALGIGLIDLVESGVIDKPIVISRGIPSGLVYNKVYHQGIEVMNNMEFIDYATRKYLDPELIHTVYIYHDKLENAQKLYDMSTSRLGNESYDKFESFNQYWNTYSEFHNEYIKTLSTICGHNVTLLTSMDYINVCK